jgi:hypothetical protein
VAAGAVFAGGLGFAADAGRGEVAVELGEQLVQLAGVLAGGGGLVAQELELGAFLEQPGLPVIKRRRCAAPGPASAPGSALTRPAGRTPGQSRWRR